MFGTVSAMERKGMDFTPKIPQRGMHRGKEEELPFKNSYAWHGKWTRIW